MCGESAGDKCNREKEGGDSPWGKHDRKCSSRESGLVRTDAGSMDRRLNSGRDAGQCGRKSVDKRGNNVEAADAGARAGSADVGDGRGERDP